MNNSNRENFFNLGKHPRVCKINNLKSIKKIFYESSGIQCLYDSTGLLITEVIVSGVHDTYIQRNITREFKNYVGQFAYFQKKICFDTGKINEISKGDVCPGQQKRLVIEYTTVQDRAIPTQHFPKSICTNNEPNKPSKITIIRDNIYAKNNKVEVQDRISEYDLDENELQEEECSKCKCCVNKGAVEIVYVDSEKTKISLADGFCSDGASFIIENECEPCVDPKPCPDPTPCPDPKPCPESTPCPDPKPCPEQTPCPEPKPCKKTSSTQTFFYQPCEIVEPPKNLFKRPCPLDKKPCPLDKKKRRKKCRKNNVSHCVEPCKKKKRKRCIKMNKMLFFPLYPIHGVFTYPRPC